MSFLRRLFGGRKAHSESKVSPFNEKRIEAIVIICGTPKLQMTESEGKISYSKFNQGWSGSGCVKVVNTTRVDECTTDVTAEYMKSTNDTLVIVQNLESAGHVFRFITVVRGMTSSQVVFLGGPIPFTMASQDVHQHQSNENENRYRKAAEQGDAQAQMLLGEHCWSTGVENDQHEAVKWFCKAAEQGFAEAQRRLFGLYFFGDGVVKKDVQLAMTWCRKAAEQGHADCQFSLGLASFNQKEKIKWLTKAAEQGHADAKTALEIAMRG